LGNVPYWAINEAIRGWYQGRYGDGHNYTWQPAPATLRSLAFLELSKIRSRMGDLECLLHAEPERELPPPSERPTWEEIRAKLPRLGSVPDAPIERQPSGYAKRALAALKANRFRRKMGVAPTVFELDPTDWDS
jgi:hypothetical protein